MEKQVRRLIEEVESMREEIREQERKGKEERMELRDRVEGLERKMEVERGIREGRGKEEIAEGVKRGWEKKMGEIERRIEWKDKEERRKNIIIRGIEVKEGRRKEAVQNLINQIGAKVEILDFKRIGGVGEKGEESILVKLKNEEQKREIMKKKKELKGRKERVMEDWTWIERKMRWRLEEIAREEERKGRRVWIGYGRIRIEEQWWKWDESEEVLKDEKGRRRERMQGEKKEERREEGN
ncbi:hypothetical protein X777_10502 [Ooceraea biroi]|uniref:Uncharacterized protein n=1 Tax=Ooceraea biroi TaxID=2015173 RepID=A0A026X055_OOCBI|nr:hypothetical protein X777_10502 [Ooceraea biroi]